MCVMMIFLDIAIIVQSIHALFVLFEKPLYI